MIKSVLKTAGSLGANIVNVIFSLLPDHFNVIHEPCGGSLVFSLNNPYNQRSAIDSNNIFVKVHNAVKNCPDELIAALATLHTIYNGLLNMDAKRGFYKEIRSRLNSSCFTVLPLAEQAAIYVCVTRLSVNGQFRTNSKGKFNVPFGRKEKADICDEKLIRDANAAMGSLSIKHGNYEEVVDAATADDFVLLQTLFFAGNKKSVEENLCKLFGVFTELVGMNVKVMLITNDSLKIMELYNDYLSKLRGTGGTRSYFCVTVIGRGPKAIRIIRNYLTPIC